MISNTCEFVEYTVIDPAPSTLSFVITTEVVATANPIISKTLPLDYFAAYG